MLYDTSTRDKVRDKEINTYVGSSYNFFDVLFKKNGVIGSSKMEVVAYSKLFDKVMSKRKQAVFANISLRPNGIIVIMNIRLSNYSWVIPYRYLSIFKTDLLVIHGQGEFLKLKIQGNQNKKIISKILKIKNELGNNEYYG